MKPHYHACANKAAGCTWSLACYGQSDGGDPECCADALRFNLDGWECDDCVESRCKECGSVTRIESHDKHCTLNPNYDPTPWELPGDGASTGPESRAAEAWAIKRAR